jgi:hypothetical protein
MRHVETIPGMGGRRIRENDGGVNSIMKYCKNFCKCHSVSQNNNIIKNKRKKEVFGTYVLFYKYNWPKEEQTT